VRFRPYGIPRDEWDDVVQQTVAMLWRACGKSDFALKRSLRALVRTIVMARCIDWLRRRRPSFEIEETLVDPSPARTGLGERGRMGAGARRPPADGRGMPRDHPAPFPRGASVCRDRRALGRAEATLRVRMFHCMKEIRRLLGTALAIALLLGVCGARDARASSPAVQETEARQDIARLEAARAPDSLALASAFDRLVEALSRQGKAYAPETRRLALASLGIRERALGGGHPEWRRAASAPATSSTVPATIALPSRCTSARSRSASSCRGPMLRRSPRAWSGSPI